MTTDVMDELIGKKVFLILKTNRNYTGEVKSFENNLLIITDKFGETVLIAVSEISSLEVEHDK